MINLYNIIKLLNNKLLNVKYYKLAFGGNKSNKDYIIKVSSVDNIVNEVSAYIEVIENKITKLIKVTIPQDRNLL